MTQNRIRIAWLLAFAALAFLGCKKEKVEDTQAPAETIASGEAPIIAPPPKGELPAPADVAGAPEGAEQTESGVACVVLRKGTGTEHPEIYDTVMMHQVVWTTDGKMHMNTGNRGGPVEFDVTKSVLPGLREAIELMVVGEKRRCWIPGHLAFGEATATPATDGRPRGTLVYELDLVGLEKVSGLPEAPQDVASVPEDAQRSESGLAWRVLQEGTGDKTPEPTSIVSMNYTAWTTDGEVITSTAKKGFPRSSSLGGVIPGLREGLLSMKLGEKRRLWIPPELAYAGRPGHPQGMVVYDVELIAIAP